MLGLDLFVQTITHLEEFPKKCWERLVELIRTRSVRDNLPEFLACAFSLGAYFASKLINKKPVIGAEGPTDVLMGNQEETATAELVDELVKASGFQPSTVMEGPVREAIVKRALAMLWAYVLTALQDPDKMEEYFEMALSWISENLVK